MSSPSETGDSSAADAAVPGSMPSKNMHAEEVAAGKRFSFGANWQRFATTLDDDRLRTSADSLAQRISQSAPRPRPTGTPSGRAESLPPAPPARMPKGWRFLDIGCGSGIFSLAAHKMGATVVSIDYDPDAVACTRTVKDNYRPDDGHDAEWQVEEISVLDASAMEALGQFDVVYAWGSLHHTGQMWAAIDQALLRVSPGGIAILAIYNDQGIRSHLWRGVKRVYCSSALGRGAVLSIAVPYFYTRAIVGGLTRGQSPLATLSRYRTTRGMSRFHDIVDWVGGLPFEVARPDTVERFATERGFERRFLHNVGNAHGNNEYVFVRVADIPNE